MEFCPSPAAELGLVRGLMDTVDCNVRNLVEGGYGALTGPNAEFSAIITGMLTIYIAVLGYQLLFGRGARIADLPLIGLKIGVILAMVTNWSAFHTAVYGLLFDGPHYLANQILAGLRPAKSALASDVLAGLQVAFDQLTASAQLYADQAGPNARLLQGGPAFASFALWSAGVGLLVSTLGVLLVAKIVLGFLLAAAPVFIALFLFEATRGLFVGWLRAALGVALAPLAATVFLAIMLVMLEPLLIELARLREQGLFAMQPVLSATFLVLVFVLVFLQILNLGSRIAAGFQLAPPRAGLPRRDIEAVSSAVATAPAISRAAATAAAVRELERREERSLIATDRRAIVAIRDAEPARTGLDLVAQRDQSAEQSRRARDAGRDANLTRGER
jgi:type IV secretion system protein VirB6